MVPMKVLLAELHYNSILLYILKSCMLNIAFYGACKRHMFKV